MLWGPCQPARGLRIRAGARAMDTAVGPARPIGARAPGQQRLVSGDWSAATGRKPSKSRPKVDETDSRADFGFVYKIR